MDRIKIAQEILNKLPSMVLINDEWYSLIWERHADGYNFVSYRFGPEELVKLARVSR
jgi:hypothetical protein